MKNKTKSKTYHCALQPTNNLRGLYINSLGKETGEFLHHFFFFFWKIRQHYPEANGQCVLCNECEKYKHKNILSMLILHSLL